MNSGQQVAMRNSLLSLKQFTPMAEKAYAAWQKTNLPSGYQLYNKAALYAARNSKNPAASKAAQTLINQITDMQEAVAKVYMGTASPTDQSLKMAQKQLAGEWNATVFASAIDTIKQATSIRLNVMNSPEIAGVPGDNPYAPQQPGDPDDPYGILTPEEKQKLKK